MVFAGIMDFDEGLVTVQKRGAAMQEAADATAEGGMVTIIRAREGAVLGEICEQARQGEVLEIANFLARQTYAWYPARTSACFAGGGRTGYENGRDESRSIGGGRGISYRDHASGRSAAGGGPG